MAQLLEVIGPKAGGAPLRYVVTEQGTVDLMSIFARFDGSAASGDWRPTVTIRAQDGTILVRVPVDETLPTGDTADVTFAPFLRAGATSSGSGGIAFDTFPQEGTYLFLTTTGLSPLSTGLDMRAQKEVVIRSETDDVRLNAELLAQLNGGTVNVIARDGGMNITAENGTLEMSAETIDVEHLGSGEAKFHSQGSVSVQALEGGMEINQFDTAADLVIATSRNLVVLDDNGLEIFRIDQNGALHGKTGQALVFDL